MFHICHDEYICYCYVIFHCFDGGSSHLLNQSIMLSFLWQNYITILLLMQLLFELYRYPKVLTLSKEKTYLPTYRALSLLLTRDLTVQWKAFRIRQSLVSISAILFMVLNDLGQVMLVSFTLFLEQSAPTSIQKHIERLHWISQISAGSLRAMRTASSIYPKVTPFKTC